MKKFAGSEKNITFATAFGEMHLGMQVIVYVYVNRHRWDFQAEIAQLVEHNLAKVGVAGPSPVFRSTF